MPATNGIFNQLPPEYQAQLDELQRKRALAQSMQQQSLNFKGAQSHGAQASKTPLFAALANALTGVVATQADKSAGQDLRGVQVQAGNDQQAELARLQTLPLDEQISQGQRSKWGTAQKLAASLQAAKEKRAELGVTAIKDRDPTAALGIAATGDVPSNYTAPASPNPTSGTAPDGSTYMVTTDNKGQQTVHFAPKGVNVNNILPNKEGEDALGFHVKQLEGRQKDAGIAKDTLAANSRAVDALESGARAGGGEGIKQGLRSALQAFGLTSDAGAPTEQLQQALGNELLNNARKLAPVTGTDIKVLEGILGNMNSDPTALTKALAFNHAMALKALGGFNDYVDTQNATLKTPYAKDLFNGASKGYEMPKALIGPTPFQLETVRNYQNMGGDISKFNDPVTGKPMDPGSKFQITKPTAGFPGVQGNVPQTNQNPTSQKPINQMSEAEKQAEIAALKKQLGM